MKTRLTTVIIATALCIACPTPITDQPIPQTTRATPQTASAYLTQEDVAAIAKRKNAKAILIPVAYKYPYKDLTTYTINNDGQPIKSGYDMGKGIADLTGNYTKRFKGHYFVGIEGTLGVAVDNDSERGFELRKCDSQIPRCAEDGYSVLVVGNKATPKELRDEFTVFSAYVAERKELGITRMKLDTVAAGIAALGR